MYICSHCGKTLSITPRVSRESICPHCSAWLHSCVNCRFYSPGRHNDCFEPQAEYVSGKKASNFCDFFVFKETSREGISPGEKKKKSAREEFDKLFGG